jgi:hypothetical protein
MLYFIGNFFGIEQKQVLLIKKMKELSKREIIFFKFMEIHCFSVLQYISLKGIKNEEVFKKSIEKILDKYQILQQVIVFENEKYYFKDIENYKEKFFNENYEYIEKKDEKHEKDEKKDENESESNENKQAIKELYKELEHGVMKVLKNKNETTLLIRIKFIFNKDIENSEIILSYFHGILDGQSLLIILNDLFTFLSKIQNNEEEINIKFIKKFEKKEDLPIDYSKSKDIKYLPLQCKLKQISTKDKKEYFVFKKILPNKFKIILKKCKENDVTFTNFISSCLIFSIIQNFCSTEDFYFDITTVVNLRAFLGLNNDDVGEFMSNVKQFIKIESKFNNLNPKLFWETSKNIKKEINEIINKSIIYT